MIKLSRQAALELAKITTNELAQMIVVTCHQRMLDQRIEVFYLLCNRGFDEEGYAVELASAKKQFVFAQDSLNACQAVRCTEYSVTAGGKILYFARLLLGGK